MEWTEVREGAIRLRVPPSARRDRGPGAHDADVFFNPAMATNRDVSVAVAAAHTRPLVLLDGLAASGARGLRIAAEVPSTQVELNDWNPVAARLIRENADLNGLKVEVTNRNLGALLWERVWDWVDVDPFGSPSGFVDAATRAVRDGGVLALTATDTTALYGVYPEVCRRRYMADPIRSEVGHELALRILAGFAARQGAKHEMAFRPFLAHATDHYYRVYLRASRGAAAANATHRETGFAWFCDACGARGLSAERTTLCPECELERPRVGGRLWAGALQEHAFVERVLAETGTRALARPEETRALLAALAAEAEAPPLFYDLQECVSRAGTTTPRREAFIAALLARGFTAARSHVSPLAIKTDARMRDVKEILAEISPR